MHAVGLAQKRDVDVVVDDQERRDDQRTKAAGQGEELASSQCFMTELDDVGSASNRGRGDFENAVRIDVRSDDVEVGCAEQVQPPHPALRATFPAGGEVTAQYPALRATFPAGGEVTAQYPALRATFPAGGEVTA
jgi:hypothetical protein